MFGLVLRRNIAGFSPVYELYNLPFRARNDIMPLYAWMCMFRGEEMNILPL